MLVPCDGTCGARIEHWHMCQTETSRLSGQPCCGCCFVWSLTSYVWCPVPSTAVASAGLVTVMAHTVTGDPRAQDATTHAGHKSLPLRVVQTQTPSMELISWVVLQLAVARGRRRRQLTAPEVQRALASMPVYPHCLQQHQNMVQSC